MKKNRVLIGSLVLFLVILSTATVYSRMVYQKDLPKVSIDIAKSGILPGSGSQERYDCVISKYAVFTEPSGVNYILCVQQRDGAWGKEYFCTQQYVSVLAESETHAAISGDTPKYPIIIESDKPVRDGSIVRLYP